MEVAACLCLVRLKFRSQMFIRPSDVDAMCDAAGSLDISEAEPKGKAKAKAKAKAAACIFCLVCLTFRSYRFVTPCDVDAMHVLENYVTCIYITEHIQGHCRSIEHRARAPT